MLLCSSLRTLRACARSSSLSLPHLSPNQRSLRVSLRNSGTKTFSITAPAGATVTIDKETVKIQQGSIMEPQHDPNTKFRKDYTPTPYLINNIFLDFILNEDITHVHSQMRMRPNYPSGSAPPELLLDGRKDVKLVSIKVNGSEVPAEHFVLSEKQLVVKGLPAGEFDLAITTEIKPQENTLLEGLYKSGGNFSTQCEAEGFRGITFFLDRPDVMTTYTTRIEAPKDAYPVLLGNGNLKESGALEGGRHFAVWVDPFPKPSYLFALVAGNLSCKERKFITCSGKEVTLRIFVQENNLSKVDFALESLVKSMKWDEEAFGLEYDLDLFNIVAVDDFNMGAMENKSLNIFNSRLVLASPETATDGDYARIEGVVGHEYFHNWTGNRVTCRDWFQLTLKEGLTVFRDQEFSADMNSRPVKRIEDVSMLRASQFAEDRGPTAHPIRPDSYIKMDNFYTLTVYEKGAEVVRLYSTLLGKEGFRKGMDLYFKRHDGCAVTCDDFRAAMADANGVDLSAMSTWYSQAGTPNVDVTTQYNAGSHTFTLKVKQYTKSTPGQNDKAPVLIPLAVGLLGSDGKDLPLHLRGSQASADKPPTTMVLRLEGAEQEFVFEHVDSEPVPSILHDTFSSSPAAVNQFQASFMTRSPHHLPHEPVPSILRDFSAPVKLNVEGQSDEHLLFLFANDSDPFNRWESGQRLLKKLLLRLYTAADDAKLKSLPIGDRCREAGGVGEALAGAFRNILKDESVDGSYKAMAISIPSASEMLDQIQNADPVLLHEVRMFVVKELSARLRPELEALMKQNDDAPGTPYVFSAAACARRAIKNKCLVMLAALELPETTALALGRFRGAANMTDSISALSALVEVRGAERQLALDEFYNQWKEEPLVILKWLGLQAMSNAPGNLELVKKLVDHPAFNITNPNNCYSLFLGFARSPMNFHAVDGSGYQFMGDVVLKVDKLNHQVAARMVGAFTSYRQYDTTRQELMRAQLSRIVAENGLSENVLEIANKALAA
ncbi:hypothetical protein CEUSTIGMA_g9004.t1 [Chlamydomonas eustigma]|uniref:Peptidase M1 leukotriene A4 hydrolase/aminopeptidase C-terminal domain-containing protein n=1 Tax=Chlamydomonas eustigma TaxID=1157962 RepID=A0A250XEX1_9CHLO|nr:hypothetical protein CEUSTIGMA_g9004.t1 [Chlamydomonas eustigma]|eukprot:GAX81576.1 hypothetical protein CEUSTIGMA_g9004.t1 [Chlamydomonas eustigma]